jgi:hypothetical protein
MVNGKKSIFKIPYLRALKSWNQKCNPIKKKAWVLPFGPAKAKNNELYNQIVDIRKGINVECSSAAHATPKTPPAPKPKTPTPPPPKPKTPTPPPPKPKTPTPLPAAKSTSKQDKIKQAIEELKQKYNITDSLRNYYVPGKIKKDFLDEVDTLATKYSLDPIDFEDYWTATDSGPYLAINYFANDVPMHLRSKGVKLLEKHQQIAQAPVPVFRHSSHFEKYQRDGYKHGKKYTFTYEMDDAPIGLKLPANQVTLGSGSYASVIEGTWDNKPAAVKFQIVDAKIPQPFEYRECVEEGDQDCFTMTKSTFDTELKYLLDGSSIGIGPKIWYHGFVDCTDVKVQPPVANKLRKPDELGLIVMEKIKGEPLWKVLNNNVKLRYSKKFKDSVKSELLQSFKKLYDKFNYAWYDFHFGNIMYDKKSKKLTIIDMGDLGKTQHSWSDLETYYKNKIDVGFS